MRKILFALVAFSISSMAFAQDPNVDGTLDSSYGSKWGVLENGSGVPLADVYVYYTFSDIYIYVDAYDDATIINDAEETFARLFVQVEKKDGFTTINSSEFDQFVFTGEYWEARVDVSTLGDFQNLQVHSQFNATSLTGEQESTGTFTAPPGDPKDPDPREPSIPIDGGLGILALVGLGFGVYKRVK